MKIGRIDFRKGSEKYLGLKVVRLPRKKKKKAKKNWGNKWMFLIKLTNRKV